VGQHVAVLAGAARQWVPVDNLRGAEGELRPRDQKLLLRAKCLVDGFVLGGFRAREPLLDRYEVITGSERRLVVVEQLHIADGNVGEDAVVGRVGRVFHDE
jgi:hypothetical protein